MRSSIYNKAPGSRELRGFVVKRLRLLHFLERCPEYAFCFSYA
nr:MAG TPA: hypothetical protein [Caudoviricetes sp.]